MTKPPRIILSTQRLTLREVTLDDTKFILKLVNSPGWLTYIGDRNIYSLEAARQYIQESPLSSYVRMGYGLWLVELTEVQTAIGLCGLLKRPYLDAEDIGYAFLPEYTGQGYALEIVSAMIERIVPTLGIRKLFAIVLPGNQRSIRLLEKLNFTKTATLPPNDQGQVLDVYGTSIMQNGEQAQADT